MYFAACSFRAVIIQAALTLHTIRGDPHALSPSPVAAVPRPLSRLAHTP